MMPFEGLQDATKESLMFRQRSGLLVLHALLSGTFEGPQLCANKASIRGPESTFHMEVERNYQGAISRH